MEVGAAAADPDHDEEVKVHPYAAYLPSGSRKVTEARLRPSSPVSVVLPSPLETLARY